MLTGMRIGFAMTGSYCTFDRVLRVLPELIRLGADVTPILSENAYATDTRFMKAKDLIGRLEEICGKHPVHDIVGAEPIGPKKLLDLLIVAPATGCTIGKLAYGITDTCIAMACKAQWRNGRPVLIAVSTNDGLSTSEEAIAKLERRKDCFLLPYERDDPDGKPDSLVAKMELIPEWAGRILQRQEGK